mgnify:FL=1
MKEFEFVVTDPQGIHARPAGLLVKEAKKFESNISVFKGARKGDLKKNLHCHGFRGKAG